MIAACSRSLRSDDPRTDIFCVITRCAKTTPFHTTHLIIPHHSPHKNSEMTPYHVKETPSPSQSPPDFISHYLPCYTSSQPTQKNKRPFIMLTKSNHYLNALLIC